MIQKGQFVYMRGTTGTADANNFYRIALPAKYKTLNDVPAGTDMKKWISPISMRDYAIALTPPLHPTSNLILVWPFPIPEVTKGGIILTAENKEVMEDKPRHGIVLRIGANEDKVPIPVEVGETVWFSKFAGHAWEHPVTKEKYHYIRTTDIWARQDGEDSVLYYPDK